MEAIRAGVAIRPCRSDECATVLELWKDAAATPSISDTVENLMRLVREYSDLFLVAEHDGRLVGTVIAGWDGWRANIYRLAVLPNYRRRGVGRALVEEVESRLFAKGARRISILVEHKDAVAVSFWNSLNDIGHESDPRMVRYIKTL